MSQAPSVGDVVHYVSHGSPVQPDGSQQYPSVCRAAIVTEVHPENRSEGLAAVVGLAVLNPEGMFFKRGCEHDELPPADKILPGERAEHRGGTWHWPEFV